MQFNRTRFALAATVGLAALWLPLAASATDVAPPVPGPAASRHQIVIEPSLLDAYAGAYLLGDNAVLTVRREGDHLTIQLTGQPAASVYPESRTVFFAKVVDARFAFRTEPSGKVSGVVLHQFGRDTVLPRIDAARAEQVTARTEARVKAQSPSPGTEAAARRLDSESAAGKPPYDVMTPELAAATKAQIARIQPYLAGLGPIQDVRFLGVNPQGADVYDIRHANGIDRWTVALNRDGKIAGALVAPGP